MVAQTDPIRPGAQGGAGALRSGSAKTVAKGSGVIVMIMLLAIFSPIILQAGPISLPTPRLVVLILFTPAFFMWLAGKLGPFRLLDAIMLSLSSWIVISMMKVHGMSEFEFAAAAFLETLGPYLIGRWAVRDANGFFKFVKLQFLFLLILFPFAIIESQTGDPPIMRVLQSAFKTWPIIDHEIRLGLERSQVVFQHPILYGYFAATTLGLTLYVINYGAHGAIRFWRLFMVFLSTFMSLSSGPLSGFVMQAILSGWERLTRGFNFRWGVIISAMILFYVAIDLLSDRTPFHVFVRYLTFNTGAAYNRILIFEYGTQNMFANPIFGLGLKDWVRPPWMVSSVDNFWLALGMRHGFPGLILLVSAVVVMMIQLGRKKIPNKRIASMRIGVNISLVGTIFIGATVHLWGPVYIWLWFFIGASMWLLEDWPSEDGEQVDNAEPTTRLGRYTRFPKT